MNFAIFHLSSSISWGFSWLPCHTDTVKWKSNDTWVVTLTTFIAMTFLESITLREQRYWFCNETRVARFEFEYYITIPVESTCLAASRWLPDWKNRSNRLLIFKGDLEVSPDARCPSYSLPRLLQRAADRCNRRSIVITALQNYLWLGRAEQIGKTAAKWPVRDPVATTDALAATRWNN